MATHRPRTHFSRGRGGNLNAHALMSQCQKLFLCRPLPPEPSTLLYPSWAAGPSQQRRGNEEQQGLQNSSPPLAAPAVVKPFSWLLGNQRGAVGKAQMLGPPLPSCMPLCSQNGRRAAHLHSLVASRGRAARWSRAVLHLVSLSRTGKIRVHSLVFEMGSPNTH